jgi:hypothetical protein
MHHAGIICAALAFGILTFPVAAQQIAPGQPLPPAQQTAPEMPPAPRPELQTPPEAPPPFPPMPSAAPTHRWVNIGQHRATHANHTVTHVHHKAKRSTLRTMRWCRSTSHRQMMRHSTCRAHMRNHRYITKHRRHDLRHQRRVALRHRTEHRRGIRHHVVKDRAS